MLFFRQFLDVAPMSLAVWRAVEAQALKDQKFSEPLLDLGCGFGEFSGVFFKEQLHTGLDIDGPDLGLAHKTTIYRHLIRADARHMPFADASYQTVFSLSVLEHISQVEKVFPEVFRILKPQGNFIFTVPTQTMNRHLVVPKLLRTLGLPQLAKDYLKKYHQVFKHEIIRPKAYWLNLVREAKFELVECQPTISISQLRLFELSLPLAYPSQLARHQTGQRGIVPNPWRTTLWTQLLQPILSDTQLTDSNIMVICQKK